VLTLALFAAQAACAQQTIFDVPSPDVLEQGKVYGELDGTARPVNPSYTLTPRVVVGVGHDIEAGMNFVGLSEPASGENIVSPTVKWRMWSSGESGWSFYVGDDLFLPVRKRTYDTGNYLYACFAKKWKSGTRVSFGGYDFTQHVVAQANRAGGQFTFEQPVSKPLTLATEWYTGNHANGYVNSGMVIKLTWKLTLYAAYQVGNAGVTKGNHQFLWEFGYNFN